MSDDINQFDYFNDMCELTMGPKQAKVSQSKLRNAVKGMFLAANWMHQFPHKMVQEQQEYMDVHLAEIEGDMNHYFQCVLNCPAFVSLVEHLGGSFNTFRCDFYKLIFNYGNKKSIALLETKPKAAYVKERMM